jgi:hypothetical protein
MAGYSTIGSSGPNVGHQTNRDSTSHHGRGNHSNRYCASGSGSDPPRQIGCRPAIALTSRDCRLAGHRRGNPPFRANVHIGG